MRQCYKAVPKVEPSKRWGLMGPVGEGPLNEGWAMQPGYARVCVHVCVCVCE